MIAIQNGKTVKVTSQIGVTPMPKSDIVGLTGNVMRHISAGSLIILAVDIAGTVYWIPQTKVEIV